MFGGGRFGKGIVRESRRPAGKAAQEAPAGVRDAIVARKPGNSGGAKGGREANAKAPWEAKKDPR